MQSSNYGYGYGYYEEGGCDQPQMMNNSSSCYPQKPSCGGGVGYQYHSHSHSHIGLSPAQGQTVRIYSQANPDFSLGIRDGCVRMVYFNPDDPTQQWVRDERWSNSVKDSVGHPAFCLVNKATGQALRHAAGPCQDVLLTAFDGDSMDEKTLWSMSEDMGYGYRTLRAADNIRMNLDAYQGDPKYGGVRDGTRAVMWSWNKNSNQLWKISPCY